MDPLNVNPLSDTYRGLVPPSITEFDLDLPLEDLSFNPTEHHERMVVGTLRSEAGREYDTDGFSRRTIRTIIKDLRDDGHRPGAIIVPSDGLDLFDHEDCTHYDGEVTAVSSVNFHGWSVAPLETPGVLDGEAFVVGEDSLMVPEHAPCQILVRHPSGVAHYEF